MNNKVQINKDSKRVLIVTFILFFIISLLAPITGDDWKNFVIGNYGFLKNIENVWEMYLTWEGRIASRFLINLLTPHKLLFNFIFSLLMSFGIYSIHTLMEKASKKEYYLVPLLGLLLVNVSSFASNYTWITGCITYTFPAIMTIIYFTYLLTKKDLSFNFKEVFLLSFISLIIPMFVENIGVSLVLGNIILFIIYLYKNKKVLIPLLTFSIVSILSLIFMISSPGSAIRMNTETTFYSLNIFQKIFTNIPNLLTYTFTNNFIITTLMLIPINYFLYKKYKDKKIIYKIIVIIFNLVPIFNIFCNFYQIIPINILLIFDNYEGILLPSNWYFIFYWIIFSILFINSILYIVKDSKKKFNTLFIYFISLGSNLVMLISPVWGERVSFLYILGIIIVISILINDMRLKLSFKLLRAILILLGIYYISIYSISCYINYKRTNYIKEQLKEDKEIIEVIGNPFHLVWNYNPTVDGQIKKFKLYYNIPNDKNIVITYTGLFYKIKSDIN